MTKTDLITGARQLRLLGIAVLGATVVTIACSESKNPNTPTSTTTTTTTSSVAPALAAPAPRGPIGGAQITGLRPTLEVENAKTTGTVSGSVTYRFEISEQDSFPSNSRTVTVDGIAQGDGTTRWTVNVNLIPNLMYHWRARATNGTITSDYSPRETVKTENIGIFTGQNVIDPLTNGKSVGNVIGGTFIPGRGWQAQNLTDAIDYDIPTMVSGLLEFDIEGIEEDEPGPYDIGMKLYAMGDGNQWDFNGFRNQAWKVSLDKKSGRLFRGESGVLESIFRLFDDDNRVKTSERNWEDNRTYHVLLTWGSGRMGLMIDNEVIADESYGGSYNPPNHRISLGCRSRGETLKFATWSNVRITPR